MTLEPRFCMRSRGQGQHRAGRLVLEDLCLLEPRKFERMLAPAANWMLEATPGQPYQERLEDLLEVEKNMLLRRQCIQKFLL
jgi:hypothetical protein